VTYTLKTAVVVDREIAEQRLEDGGNYERVVIRQEYAIPAGSALLLTDRRDHVGRAAFRVVGANCWLWLHFSEVE